MTKVKFIILIFCISIILPLYNVYALEYVNIPVMSGRDLMGSETIIPTGSSYLKWVSKERGDFEVYYSKDKENWILITNEDSKTDLNWRLYDTEQNIVKCKVVETDDYIIMVPHLYQESLGIRNMTMTYPGSVRVLKKNNFNEIKRYYAGGHIGLASYIDGVFYALIYTDYYSDNDKDMQYLQYRTATKQKTVYTTDFENWHDYSDDGSIPITNGRNILMTRNSLITAKDGINLNADREIKPQKVYVQKNSSNLEVIYESVDVAQIFPLRDLYIGIPSTETDTLRGKFLVSYDGVYFNTVDLLYADQNLYTMSEIQDGKILMSVNSYERAYVGLSFVMCDYKELKEYASEALAYVQLDNKILGFEQPPVIENDRLLVPMRLLFEQMGADVDWNSETQTATASINTTAVGFAIDDVNAAVNGSLAVMEVPARLVNGKTMVPLRFLSEELGYTVMWDEETRTAIIE